MSETFSIADIMNKSVSELPDGAVEETEAPTGTYIFNLMLAKTQTRDGKVSIMLMLKPTKSLSDDSLDCTNFKPEFYTARDGMPQFAWDDFFAMVKSIGLAENVKFTDVLDDLKGTKFRGTISIDNRGYRNVRSVRKANEEEVPY